MHMSNLRIESILNALKGVQDPDFKQDIVSLNFVRDLEVDGSTVRFRLVLNTPISPPKTKLREAAQDAIRRIDGVDTIDISLDSEIPKGSSVAGKQSVPGVSNIIAVSSGKGG